MADANAIGPFAKLVPNETDRAMFVGKTGSGKSYAARRFLHWVRDERSGMIRPRKYVIGYDAKGLLRWPEAVRVTTFEDLVRKANDPYKYPWIIYAPTHSELKDAKVHEAFFKLIYERGNTTAYIDELRALCRGAWRSGYPDYLDAILTRGREMKIPVIMATQEPTNIPSTLFSQSDCIFAFHQKKPSHAKMVADYMAEIEWQQLLPMTLKKKFFYFYRDGDDQSEGPHILRDRRREAA